MSGRKTGQLNQAVNLNDVNGIPYDSTNPLPVNMPFAPAGGNKVTLYDASGNPIHVTTEGIGQALDAHITNPTIEKTDSSSNSTLGLQVGGRNQGTGLFQIFSTDSAGRLAINMSQWVGNSGCTLGQKTNANSVPVVWASDLGLPAGTNYIGNVRITDGSLLNTLLNLTNSKPMTVALVDGAGNQVTSFGGTGGTSQTDKSAFTEGSGSMTPVGGVLNDTIGADPTEDQAAALRITAKRGLHVNLRDNAGNEWTLPLSIKLDQTGSNNDVDVLTLPSLPTGGNTIGKVDQAGTSNPWIDDITDRVARKLGQAFLRNPGDTANMGDATTPVRTDPTGTTTQPISFASQSIDYDGRTDVVTQDVEVRRQQEKLWLKEMESMTNSMSGSYGFEVR